MMVKKCNGVPVPKHNAMNEYSRSKRKFPRILLPNTMWNGSALSSSCFIRQERYLVYSGQGEGNPTKMVMMTETNTQPFSVNQSMFMFMNGK
jgi:hypothetical protein